jgi:hypothetical protein
MTGESKVEKRLIESLPGDLRHIAQVAGLEAAIRIARAFRGTYLYVPDLMRQIRDEKIRHEYDRGRDFRSLALEYGLTQRQIRNILCETLPIDDFSLPRLSSEHDDERRKNLPIPPEGPGALGPWPPAS